MKGKYRFGAQWAKNKSAWLESALRRSLRSLRSNEPVEPLANRLLEDALLSLLYLGCLTFCFSAVFFSSVFLKLWGEQVPLDLVMTVALLNYAVHLATVPLSTSFRAMLGMHLIGITLFILYLVLILTSSPALSILYPVTVATVALSFALNTRNHESIGGWQALRVGLLIVSLFLIAGKYVFAYSFWLYQQQWLGIPLFETKDRIVVFACMLILLISATQALARLIFDPADLPGTSFIMGWVRSIKFRLSRITDVHKPLSTHSMTSTADAIGWAGKQVAVALLHIGRLLLWFLAFFVGTLALAFTLVTDIRITIRLISPILLLLFVTIIACKLAPLLVYYPLLNVPPPDLLAIILLWLGLILASSAFAYLHYFTFHSKDATGASKNRQLRYQRLFYVQRWVFLTGLVMALWALAYKGIVYKRVDVLSLCCLVAFVLMWSVYFLLRQTLQPQTVSDEPSKECVATPSLPESISRSGYISLTATAGASVATLLIWRWPSLSIVALGLGVIAGASIVFSEYGRVLTRVGRIFVLPSFLLGWLLFVVGLFLVTVKLLEDRIDTSKAFEQACLATNQLLQDSVTSETPRPFVEPLLHTAVLQMEADGHDVERVRAYRHTDRRAFYNALAWHWATCRKEDHLSAKNALTYAILAYQIDAEMNLPEIDPLFVALSDTLAAAYARNENFGRAVALEEQAILDAASLGDSMKSPTLLMQRRLHLYEERRAYTSPEVEDHSSP